MENQIFILRTPAAIKFFHQILKNCHFGVKKKIIIHADGFVCAGWQLVLPQLIFIVSVVDFCSTSHFYIYIVCGDRSGSLSGGALTS